MNWKKLLPTSKKLKIISMAALVLVIALGVNSSCMPRSSESGPASVVATIYPLYDMAKQVAGSRLELAYLMNPGESPHTFELTPERIKRLEGAGVALKVGLGLDDWLDPAISSLGAEVEIYEVHSGVRFVDENGLPNPHIWLSLENAKVIVENIHAVLSQNYPQHNDYFAENKERYINEINNLEIEFKKEAEDFGKKEFIAFHDAWIYLAEELGIEQVMSVEPFPGKEPTPEYIIELQKAIEEYDIEIIFIEPQLSAQTVNFLAQDMGLEVRVLDPLGGTEGRDTYLKLMSYNFGQLKDVLD
ncbi:MAG: metal ABC transporter substrate-binding protein [Actinomycetota bacterium]